jgi:hypothetical protein
MDIAATIPLCASVILVGMVWTVVTLIFHVLKVVVVMAIAVRLLVVVCVKQTFTERGAIRLTCHALKIVRTTVNVTRKPAYAPARSPILALRVISENVPTTVAAMGTAILSPDGAIVIPHTEVRDVALKPFRAQIGALDMEIVLSGAARAKKGGLALIVV